MSYNGKETNLMLDVANAGYNSLKQYDSIFIDSNKTQTHMVPIDLLYQLGDIKNFIINKKHNYEIEIDEDNNFIRDVMEDMGIDSTVEDPQNVDDDDVKLALDRVKRNGNKRNTLEKAENVINYIIENDILIDHKSKDKMNMPLVATLTMKEDKLMANYVTLKNLIAYLFMYRLNLKNTISSFSIVLALHYHVEGIKVEKKVINEIDHILHRYRDKVKGYIRTKEFNDRCESVLSTNLGKIISSVSRKDVENNHEKVGKFIKKIYPNIESSVIETLAHEFNKYFNIDVEKYEENFDIVSGNDIVYYYNSYNNTYIESIINDKNDGESKGGSLRASCMRYNGNNKEIETYALNPSKVNMLILKDNNKNSIIGRALLWKVNGYTYVDRIYSISNSVENLIVNYINKKGFIGIHPSSNNNKNKDHKFIISLKVGRNTPYIDTLSKELIIKTKNKKVYIILSYKSRMSEITNFIKNKFGIDNIESVDLEDYAEDLGINLEGFNKMMEDIDVNKDSYNLNKTAFKRNKRLTTTFREIRNSIIYNDITGTAINFIAFDKDKLGQFKQKYPELFAEILTNKEIKINDINKNKQIILEIKKHHLNYYFNKEEELQQDKRNFADIYYIKSLVNDNSEKIERKDTYESLIYEDWITLKESTSYAA